MKITKRIDLGEYIVNIEYNDDGSGHIKVTVLDELEGEIEFIEITNDTEEEDEEENNDFDPRLN
jgi:hypothetical protein